MRDTEGLREGADNPPPLCLINFMNEYDDIDMIVDVVLIVFLEPNWKAVLVFREVYFVICYILVCAQIPDRKIINNPRS
jgi:hypothetical protein